MPSITNKILGGVLALFGLTQLPPLVLELLDDSTKLPVFGICAAANLLAGGFLWWRHRRAPAEIRRRDSFLMVALIWGVLSAVAALPFYFGAPHMTAMDALFEAVSGLTTTGATSLAVVESISQPLLYYRQQLQWLGGMGIILLAVALMPVTGVGMMHLYRAELPGPVKDHRLSPRLGDTAKTLWFIYCGLTIACALAYYAAGMSAFDAIAHAYSTVASGGFSTHSENLGFFDSPGIYAAASVFMILAVLNFAHHLGLLRLGPAVYWRDDETRCYLLLLLAALAICLPPLLVSDLFDSSGQALMQGIVQIISIATATGFTTGDFSAWPLFVPMLLLFLSGAGGCTGSTAGGIKMLRVLLLFKQAGREIRQLVHPRALLAVKLNGQPVDEAVVNSVWGFLSLYVLSLLVLIIAMLAAGTDPLTAFSSVIACLHNLGPGLGAVASNYAALGAPEQAVLITAMLLGRLELYTLLVLCSPVFWRS